MNGNGCAVQALDSWLCTKDMTMIEYLEAGPLWGVRSPATAPAAATSRPPPRADPRLGRQVALDTLSYHPRNTLLTYTNVYDKGYYGNLAALFGKNPVLRWLPLQHFNTQHFNTQHTGAAAAAAAAARLAAAEPDGYGEATVPASVAAVLALEAAVLARPSNARLLERRRVAARPACAHDCEGGRPAARQQSVPLGQWSNYAAAEQV